MTPNDYQTLAETLRLSREKKTIEAKQKADDIVSEHIRELAFRLIHANNDR